MIYDITMRAILIAITILTFFSIPIDLTYAQIEDSNQFMEIEERNVQEIESEIENVPQIYTSPFLIILSLIGIGLFLSLGYNLIKRFNL